MGAGEEGQEQKVLEQKEKDFKAGPQAASLRHCELEPILHKQ